MASKEVQARHVFHTATTGADRVSAWREVSGEPAFVWGRHAGDATSQFFGPIRKLFSQWLQATDSENVITVYHDGPSADAFGMLDPATQKVLHVHEWFPHWERNFDWAIRCTGKVLVSHPGQGELLREKFGWIPERFIQRIHEPLLTGLPERQAGAAGPKNRTGIWLHGKPWKRFGNRLRSIVDRWPDNGGQLEILSSGSSRPGWSKKPFVVWSPGLPLEFALQRLFTWDSTLLIDNYSLDSPWLIRAISLDCFPLVPDGESPGRGPAWLEDSAPQPYSWGDNTAATRLLEDWRKGKEKLLPDFRKWGQELLAEDADGKSFKKDWSLAKEQFSQQRTPRLRKRRAYYPWYPVAWFERIQRLRGGH